MAKLTRSNVAYDLNVSPHILEFYYYGQSIKYYFSSNFYKTKFENKLEANRERINVSLTNRFGFDIQAEMIADFQLYSTIEKRGFLVEVDGVKVPCQEDLILSGLKISLTN